MNPQLCRPLVSLLVFGIACVWAGGCRDRGAEPPTSTPPATSSTATSSTATPSATPSATPGTGSVKGTSALARLKDAGYVGNGACADCHPDIAETFSRSAMARSIRPAGKWPTGQAEDPKLGVVYKARATADGDGVVQHESRIGAAGAVVADDERTAHLAIGSVHAVSFLTAKASGGQSALFQMPLTYYLEKAAWDLSPGYADANSRFERKLSPECLFCHSLSSWIPAPDERGVPERADDFLGIGCERCHGPGAAHVKSSGAKGTIFDPGDAPPAAAQALCDQCHLHGVARVFSTAWTGGPPDPARPLSDTLTIYSSGPTADGSTPDHATPIAGQSDRLRLSKCAVLSGDKLQCTTCHDPHRPASEIVGGRNASCGKCHGASACKRSQHGGPMAGHTAGPADCVSCHMVTQGTTDVPHTTATDHFIRRHLPKARAALNVGEEAVADADPALGVRATNDQSTLPPGEADARWATAELRLADAARYEPLLRASIERFKRALAASPDSALAHAGLGYTSALMEDWSAAVGHLERATVLAPGLDRVWRQLARAYANSSDYDAALLAMERARAVTEDLAAVLAEESKLAAKANNAGLAIVRMDEAVAHRPELSDLRRDAGYFRLQIGEATQALEAFKESCRRALCTPEGAITMAAALEQAEQFDMAVQVLEAARETGTSGEALRPAVARIAQEQDRTEVIVRWLGVEFDKQPDNIEIATRFAIQLFDIGQADKAIEVFESVERRIKPDETLLRRLGVSYGVAGKLPKAEATLRRAIKASTSGGAAETWNELGLALSGQNKKNEAIVALSKATAKDPKLAYAWFNLAMIHEEAKRPKLGLEAVSQGLRASPTDGQALAMRRRLTIEVYGTRLSPAELDRLAPAPP